MRILHVSPTFFDPASVTGGGERYSMSLAKAQAELPETEVLFLSFGAAERQYADAALQIRILRPEFLVDGNAMSPISWSLVTPLIETDIVHVHQRTTLLTDMVVMLAKALHKPVFVTDLGGGARWLGEACRLDTLVDAYLCISQFSAGRIRARPDQIRVIGGGTDLRQFYRPANARRERYFLFVGRVLPHKGVNYLIEAVHACPLKIVGPTYDSTFLNDLTRLAAGKPVEFIRDASDDDLRRLYAGALATVLPSVYDDLYGSHWDNPELFGLVLIEAMACGTPVVCTSVGSLPELVTDGETGFIVPPNNPAALRAALQKFIDEPALSEEMGRRARAVAATRFTWSTVAERSLEIYHRTLVEETA